MYILKPRFVMIWSQFWSQMQQNTVMETRYCDSTKDLKVLPISGL
jgi:hypothetical protein